MSFYENLERINDLRALANGQIVKRVVRRKVWSVGTTIIKKVVRALGAS